MSAELYFSATRMGSGKLDSPVYFFFSRASGVGKCILSYFAEFITPEYDERDAAHAYPKYRITLDVWDKLISMLSDEEELICYLADCVLSAFSFDEYVPEEYRDLEGINLQKVVRFDRWYSKVFHCASAFKETTNVISLRTENYERVIDDAYGLTKWLQMDQEVRDYLLDDQYEVYIGIG